MTIDLAKHPLGSKCLTYPVWSDEYRNAHRMLTEYEDTWGDLAELVFGAPEAYPLLRDQADRLSRITQACGPVSGWTHQQYSRLHAVACRLLPAGHEFTPANWTEP